MTKREEILKRLFPPKTAAKKALSKLKKEWKQDLWFSADCVERGTEIMELR